MKTPNRQHSVMCANCNQHVEDDYYMVCNGTEVLWPDNGKAVLNYIKKGEWAYFLCRKCAERSQYADCCR